jgi:predicted DNA-binding protein YlxM (UPF0122 family)
MTPEDRTVEIVKAFFSPIASEVLHRHEIDSVRTALAALFEYQPQVLEFYYRQKLSFLEIARRLELEPVTISGLHNRGITRLTKLLKEMAVLGKRGRPNSIGRQISSLPTQQNAERVCDNIALILTCPGCAKRLRARGIARSTRYRCGCGLTFIISREDSGRSEVQVLYGKIHTPGAARNFANEDCYSILGVERTDTWDEIKKAYRARLNEYHPDKLGHVGQEIRDYADNITKWVNLAFAQIKQRRGMR